MAILFAILPEFSCLWNDFCLFPIPPTLSRGFEAGCQAVVGKIPIQGDFLALCFLGMEQTQEYGKTEEEKGERGEKGENLFWIKNSWKD